MLVVFDTNVFHSDVHGTRPSLSGILDAPVNQAAYELFVPDVVLQELDKQFAQRTKRLTKDINKSLGDHNKELVKLGMDRLDLVEVDATAVSTYRTKLESRLSSARVGVLPIPNDLSPAVEWAIQRRKPFKESGEGFQDATIWLTILELAVARPDRIVFVSANTSDFAEPGTKSELAEALKDDLHARGRPRAQVRLVPGIDAFAAEVAALATTEASLALEKSPELKAAIEAAVLYSHLDRNVLELGLPLDFDPQVTNFEILELDLSSISELPAGDLRVGATVEADVEIDLLIPRGGFATIAERVLERVKTLNANHSETYVQALAEVTLTLGLTVTTTPDGARSQVQLESVRLAPAEILRRALTGSPRQELNDEIGIVVDGHGVDSYIPDARIESELDNVCVNGGIGVESIRVIEVLDDDEQSYAAVLEARLEADVEWAANAPTPFDADHFSGLATSGTPDAPVLGESDSMCPLVLLFTARYDDARGWHEIVVDELKLDENEQARRSSRMTAAEEFLIDLEHPNED